MNKEIEQINALKEQLIVFVATKGAGLVVAIIIIMISVWAGKTISKLILKVCEKRKIDLTLARFFSNTSKLIILALGIMVALPKIGFEITPLIALLGASAFGLSLAVQGPISNYGAGIVLIITRPFKIGDTLTLHDLTGIVDQVNLGNTQLINEDEEVITIPNRKVLGEIFTNSNNYMVVEAVVGIDYKADPEHAIRCIAKALVKVENIAMTRAPDVGIDEFAEYSINIGYRIWVETEKYHRTRYALNLSVYHALKEANIRIPFPIREREMHSIETENP